MTYLYYQVGPKSYREQLSLPPERLKMLRDAFNATMKDPEFVADVKRNKFDLDPEDGDHLAALIAKIYATPKSVIERVSNLIK